MDNTSTNSQDNTQAAVHITGTPQYDLSNPNQVGNTISDVELERIFSVPTESVEFVNVILNQSIKLGASDIIFEPRKTTLQVRGRIDGVLYDYGNLAVTLYPSIASRIKVMAKLDPTEKRRVQEGQFNVVVNERTVNMRVEVAHVVHGELIVIRIHERKTIVMDLAQLGFSNKAFQDYQNMLAQKSGLILMAGPTGSGKTTTLYSTINTLNKGHEYNVMTIEDPVEFQLEGINQMQVDESTGFTFAEGLHTILRLSPDIVLVGEIRDAETAKIAIESALTGQLVLSSAHAEDSVRTLFRLMDLGVQSYFLNSALMGIVSQRLVRRVCDACKKPTQPNERDIDLFNSILGRSPKQLTKGAGCDACNNLGYKGRIGIYEVLYMSSEVRDMLRTKVNEGVNYVTS